MKWVIEKAYEGMLIREYLQNVHFFSRRIMNSLKFDGGEILVNNQPKSVRYQLKVGDHLKVNFPPEQKGYYMKPEKIPLEIIYEDQEIIVINKEPGMVTIPSPHNPSGTVANGLLYYYEQNNIQNTVHVVTRLDRNTSGLLLIAKNRYIHSLLSKQINAGCIKRKYKAIVEGQLKRNSGTIKANIGRKEGSIVERVVASDGKKAITHFEKVFKTKEHTLVNVALETGRTHQIRVHFSYIGHPLAGDDLYGGSTSFINRQALHCFEISYEHPISQEKMTHYLPIPGDMECLIST